MIEKVLDNDWDYFNAKFQEKWGDVPRNRHNLWRFLRFAKGDIVIVPSWGTFYVCEIVDERPLLIGETYSNDLKTWGHKKVESNGMHLTSESGKKYDLGFARKVTILHKNVSKEKFAGANLTSRMKIRQTNCSLTDLKREIEKSISRFIEEKPINLYSTVLEKTTHSVLEAIKKELNPAKFEKLIKVYFTKIGASDVFIPAKNAGNKEGDADIVAVFENIKVIIYTQAKFHKGKISEWGVKQILDYKTNKECIDDGYNRIAWVITTADTFNVEAKRMATVNQIQLIDGMEFSKMLLNTGINALNTKL
jgi:restriction endonuclease Mrr